MYIFSFFEVNFLPRCVCFLDLDYILHSVSADAYLVIKMYYISKNKHYIRNILFSYGTFNAVKLLLYTEYGSQESLLFILKAGRGN